MDNNGNEIYEGDILDFGGNWRDGDERGVVGWSDKWACFIITFYTKSGGEGYDTMKTAIQQNYIIDSKVIGNIHENPKLLKHEK